ncbi:urea ABC transporter substrate-binding protein [Kocuria coralli]|uniref:Urea ABC transporter substrate-binding protein n=1 Tax=Kocuria coralli TaxID=1461025 RepID=A0A5J5KWS8_9MICC|nr:urea ABC transporter substrate-binding protein [Kocuria coralli]KAA9393932.1 urea ABC transporter substrate-binding protein [Kocuria coralli]
MSSRALLTAVLPLVGALVLTGCGQRYDPQAQAAAEQAPRQSCVDTDGDTIKVGLLNSLSGTMAVSETTVNRSLNMAIDEINADGGVLGKQIEPVTEDGASEPTIFAERAGKLIRQDCVAAVFGGWTSASRKAMLPVFESQDSLLFYPVQYEGLEASPNIFYSGATTNQQIIPALDWMREQGHRKIFLVGSDYVFPRTANRIINAYAEAHDMEIVGEEYVPMGSTEFSTIVNKAMASEADAVFNTLNGDSNVAFFRQYNAVGMDAQSLPVMSVSIAEEEVPGIGVDNLRGQYVAWDYYQTVETPENDAFVADFKRSYGENQVTSDPMEAAYTSVYLWKEMVEEAGSFDVAAVQEAADSGEIAFDAPEGTVTVDGENQHISKTPRIGQIREDGLIDTIWEAPEPVAPDPFLDGYSWAASINGA